MYFILFNISFCYKDELLSDLVNRMDMFFLKSVQSMIPKSPSYEIKTQKMVFDNGDIYDGSWLDGNKYGWGKMIYKNGDIYDGEWDICGKHGQGKMMYKNGDVYEGSWFRNNRDGNGKITYQKGDVYEGMVY